MANTCSVVTFNSLASSASCTYVVGGYQLTNLWTSNNNDILAEYEGGIELSIVISSGTNPVSERPAGGW